MAEKIKKHKDLVFIFGIGLVLAIGAILAMSGMVPLPNTVSAATTVQQQVAVTATVQEWLTFTLSTSSVVLTPDLIDAVGALNVASSSAINLLLGTNSPDGWSMSVTSTNSALKSGSNYIYSVAAGTTCTATTTGADCYGIQASSTAANVNIASIYNVPGLTTNVVGSVTSTSQTFATSTQTFASGTNVINMKVKASCIATKPSATNYADTIYLTAIATP